MNAVKSTLFPDLESELVSKLSTLKVDEATRFGLAPFDVPFKLGNCLFEAIAHFSPTHDATQLRHLAVLRIEADEDLAAIIEALAQTPDNAVRLASGEDRDYSSLKEYLVLMSEDGAWGSFTEILALSRVLNRRIVVVADGFIRTAEAVGNIDEETIFISYKSDHYRPLSVPADTTTANILAEIRRSSAAA